MTMEDMLRNQIKALVAEVKRLKAELERVKR